MEFNKALVLKRFSIDNWLDFGRSKYYLENNDWDIEAATNQFKKELVQDENAKDMTLSRHLRIVKHTSPESEAHILWDGQSISVEGEDEIVLYKEGDEADYKETKMDELIKTVPRLDVGKARFFLDKCNWNLQVAKNLAESDDINISYAAGKEKKYPSQYVDIVDDQVVCRYYEDIGPEPESELDLFYVLRDRYHYTNGEAQYVLKKADTNFIAAAHLSDLYVAYKKFGVYNYRFREKMEEFMNEVYKTYLENDPLKDVVQRMEEDCTFDRDKIAQMEFCKTYKLFKEKEKTFKPGDIKKSIDFIECATAYQGEVVVLDKDHKICQGERITDDMKIQAFTYWTTTDKMTAKIILEKVNWNMIDAFKLDDCLKHSWKPGHKTRFLKLAREYFGNVKDYKDLENKLEDAPESIERAEVQKLAAMHFRNLPEYESFLNELLGRSYVRKEKVVEIAKQSFKTDNPKFEKELNWYPDWIDFEKALELAEKYFSKDYEDFLIELLYPPYLDTQNTKRLAEKYFEMHEDYKDFVQKINELPDDTTTEYAKKVAEEFFKGREDFGDLLKCLQDLPSYDKEKAMKLARKHLRSNRQYEIFKREIKKHPYSIKGKDARHIVEKCFKDREGYNMFYTQLFSIREVQKKNAMDVAEKYCGYTKEYKQFEKEVNDYPKYFDCTEAKKIAKKHFKDYKAYDYLINDLDIKDIDKSKAISLAKKHCGYTKEYKEFKREIDNHSKDIDGEDVIKLAKNCFENTQGCLDLAKELHYHTFLGKEEIKEIARKHCGYTLEYTEFEREINEGFNRRKAKRFARKYFFDYKGYLTLVKALESEDIDKERAKFLAKKYFKKNKEYNDFVKDVDSYPVAFGPIKAKRLAEEYFKGHEVAHQDYEDLMKFLKKGDIDKKRAKDLAMRFCGNSTKYKDFEKEVNDHPKTFGRRHAKEMAEKHFKSCEGYREFLMNLENREIDTDRAKYLSMRHCFVHTNYKKFTKDVDDDFESFGLMEAKRMAVRYFKGYKGYEDIMKALNNHENIDREGAKNLASKHCGYTKEYEDFKRELNEGFGIVEAKKLAKKHFEGHEGYESLVDKLNQRDDIVKEAAKALLNEHFKTFIRHCEDYVKEVKNYPDSFGPLQAVEMVKKHFKGRQGYEEILKNVNKEDVTRERAINRAREYHGYNEYCQDYVKEVKDYPDSFGPLQAREMAEKHFKGHEGYEELLKELKNEDVSRKRATFLAKKNCVVIQKIEDFAKDANEYLDSFRSVQAKKLAEKHFKGRQGYGDLLRELDNGNVDREKAISLARKYCGFREKFIDFEKQLDKCTKDIESEVLMKLAEKYFEGHKGYENLVGEMFCLSYIDTERAKFLAQLYFGSKKQCEDFKKEVQDDRPFGCIEAKNLAEKHFGSFKGYRKFSNELLSLPKFLREDVDGIWKKYFQNIEEYGNFAEKMRNLPNSIQEKDAKILTGRNFQGLQNLGYFWNELLSLPYIDRERAKRIAKKHFGSNKSCESFQKEIENHTHGIEREKAVELAETYFKEHERYRNLLSDLDSTNIDKTTAKRITKNHFGSNKKYVNFEYDVDHHTKGFGRKEAKELAEKYFKEHEECCFLVDKIKNFPSIIQSTELIELVRSYFKYNEEYEQFVSDLEKLPSIIERQKFEKLNISQVIRYLSIWTDLDYGQLLHVYRAEENKLLWPTMKKLAVMRSMKERAATWKPAATGKPFKLDTYFLQTDLLIKEIENIVADIPRFATKKNERTRLKAKNNITTDVFEGRSLTKSDALLEYKSGKEYAPVDLDLILYKNGVFCDGDLFKYDRLKNLKEVLRGDRPFKPDQMDKELGYYFQDRMDENCPVEKLRFYLHNHYKEMYKQEEEEEAEAAAKAAAETEAKAAAEEKRIEELLKAAVAKVSSQPCFN